MTASARAQTTIVVPAWGNYARELLEAALASLVGQEVRPQIVVVDNAAEVPLSERRDATVVRSPQRVTAGTARNLGLEHVRTPLVMFWDADDVMVPGTLARLEQAMTSDPGLIAFGAAIVEDASGRRHRWPRPWIGRLIRTPRLFALLDSIWSLFPTTGATLARTDAVRASGGFSDSNSGEDWCLGVSLAFRGRLGWTEEPGRVYRIHPRSLWSRHMTASHQFRHARTVRRRIRTDGGVPSWARALLPVIALAQWGAIAGHAAVASARRIRRRDGAA
jgi:glycosyltransferase involved in cell wall biosynthesis